MANGKPDIWYPRKPTKYLADTMQLTMEEDCFLSRAMDQYWILQGPLPANEGRLQSLTRTSKAQFNRCKWIMAKYFVLVGEEWLHTELEEELAQARERKRVAQENGKSGGRPPKYQRETQGKPGFPPNSEPGNNPAGFNPGIPLETREHSQAQSSLPLPLPEREKPNTPAAVPPGPPTDPAKREIWEDLLAEFRLRPALPAEFTRYLAVVKALHAKGAKRGDVQAWAKLYRREWKVECTPEALVKWWDRFAPKPAATAQETPEARAAREERERELAEWMAMPPEERQAVARACVEEGLARMAQ